jgi:hypothetical protein
VDDPRLSDSEPLADDDPLAGAAPLVHQTVRGELEQHIASVTRNALDCREHPLLSSEQIEQLTAQATERLLSELAAPPGLYYLTLEARPCGCSPTTDRSPAPL